MPSASNEGPHAGDFRKRQQGAPGSIDGSLYRATLPEEVPTYSKGCARTAGVQVMAVR